MVPWLYEIAESILAQRSARSRMHRNKAAYPIWMEFCILVGILDVITFENFSDNRLTGLGVAGWVKFRHSPLLYVVVGPYLQTLGHYRGQS